MAKQTTQAVMPSASRTMDLAGPVSDRVQILHVILAETVARRRALWAGPPAGLSLNVDVTTEANKQELLVQVLPRFTLIGRDKADSAEEVLRVEALFVAQYRVPSFDGITKDNIDAFGKTNGIYNVWPYWREFVQSMTVRMGLPPLVVPVYRPVAGGVSQQQPKDAAPPVESTTSSRTPGNGPTKRAPRRRQHN